MNDRPGRLFLVSFLSLFLEMFLIRWLATEVRIFSHLENLALIACFAGFGIGYATQRWRVPLVLAPIGVALLTLASAPVFVAGPWTLKNLARTLSFTDVYSWMPLDPAAMPGGVLALLCVFVLILAMFVPFGRELGELFRHASTQMNVAITPRRVLCAALSMVSIREACVELHAHGVRQEAFTPYRAM
ncbi:MAG: hypothetical protein ACYCW6_29545 [Candidatus Xenobia bacterium]